MHKKYNEPLLKGEMRVIRIGRDALMEILIENLMENKTKYFQLNPDDEVICSVHLDDDSMILTYTVTRVDDFLASKNKDVDFLKIDMEVKETAQSVFDSVNKCIFQTVKADTFLL